MTVYNLKKYSTDELRSLYAKIQYQKDALKKTLDNITIEQYEFLESLPIFQIEHQIITELGERSARGEV